MESTQIDAPRRRGPSWWVAASLGGALVLVLMVLAFEEYRDSHPGTAVIHPHGPTAVLTLEQRNLVNSGAYHDNYGRDTEAINDAVTNYFAEAGIALYDVGFAGDFHGLVMTVNTHEFRRAKGMASQLGVTVQLDASDHMARLA